MKKPIPLDLRLFIFTACFFFAAAAVASFVKDWVKEMLLLPTIDALWGLYQLVDRMPQLLLWIFFLVLATLYVLIGGIKNFDKVLFAPQRRKISTPPDHLPGITHLKDIDPSNPYAQQRFARHLVELYFEVMGKKRRHARQMLADLQQPCHQLPPEVWEVFQFGLQWDRWFFLAPGPWHYLEYWAFYAKALLLLILRILLLQKPVPLPTLYAEPPSAEEGSPPMENGLPPQAYFEKTLDFIEQQLFMHQDRGVL